jgi:hypothetical protein
VTVEVALEHLDEDPRDRSRAVVLLTATADVDPPPKAAHAMRQLAAGQLPDGTRTNEERIRAWGQKPFPPTFEELPGALREFSRRISGVLSSAATRAFEAVRWRFDVYGPPRPYSSRGVKWSEDLSAWHQMPMGGTVRSMVRSMVQLDSADVGVVNALLVDGGSEPLAHYMLREARAVSLRHNTSALVIAVAAAEIGTKQLVSRFVPEATWLVEHVPSPPLERLLREYVPELPLGDVDPSLVPPPERLLEALRKGVTIRNAVAHVGTRSVDPDTIHDVLDAVQDLLWLFDYYAGHHWALAHLSYETSVAAGLREPFDMSQPPES